ncbi:MAG: SpoIIE family protein phosphatase [Succinivibrio sp.]
MKNLSIRNKLLLLIFALIITVIGSICGYLYKYQSQTYTDRELEFQSSVTDLLSTTLKGTYYSYIDRQIAIVAEYKEDMKQKVEMLREMIHNIPEYALSYSQNEILKNSYVSTLKKHDIVPVVYDRHNDSFNYNGYPNLANLKGVQHANLKTILKHEEIPDQGFFSCMKDNQDEIYLTYFLRSRSGRFTYAMVDNISEMISYYNLSTHELTISLESNIESLDSNWSGQVSVFDNRHNTIVRSPDSINLIPYISDEIINQVKKNGSYSGEIRYLDRDDSVYYISLSYFKPLDWYILSFRSKESVLASIHLMMRTIICIGLLVLLLTLLFAWLSTDRITISLTKLSHKAYAISKCNLQDTEELKKITQDLDTTSTDEVGTLTKALVAMSFGIQENMKNLIEINSKQKRIEGELSAAHDIQIGMLPSNDQLPSGDRLDIYAKLIPAKEVGGDLYDAFITDTDKLVFCIGDVSDKGMPAALFMSTCTTLLRQNMMAGHSPATAVKLVNNVLSERNPKMMFVTLLVGTIDLNSGKYTICNAGHCPPYVVKENETVQLDHVCGPSVGVIGNIEYIEYEGVLEKGETLFLYTDGISEAQNEQGQFFEDQRINDTIKVHHTDSCAGMVNAVLDSVLAFRGEAKQSDDITMMSFKRL